MTSPPRTRLAGRRGIPTWRFIVALVAIVSGAQTLAQEPVRVGTRGVVQPRLVMDVVPVYPPIALAARLSGRVIIEATIGPDGGVTSARVMQSIPMLDQAALDAVLRWEFEGPVVDGRPSAVVSTVTVDFQLTPTGGVALASPLPPDVPRDFAFVYEHQCASSGFQIDTTRDLLSASAFQPARLGLGGQEAAAVYRELHAAGVFADRSGLLTWLDPTQGVVIRDDGVEVTVTATPVTADATTPHIEFRTTARYSLSIRTEGVWTRVWPVERPEVRTPEYEQQIGAVSALVLKLVEQKDVWRGLPSDLRSCG